MPNLNLILLFYIFLFERAAKTRKLNGAQWQTDSDVEHLKSECGLPEDCAACRCSSTALIDGNSLHAGLCLLSLCTPAIKVNILISGPSTANHILTFERRFKTSGKVKEKKV